MRSLLHPAGLSLLLASLAPSVLAVITNQGPWGERVEEEVREFQGWIRGGEQDYVMTLAQVQDLLLWGSEEEEEFFSSGKQEEAGGEHKSEET